MTLDIDPFSRSTDRLREGLARYRQDIADTRIRDGLIQRFESGGGAMVAGAIAGPSSLSPGLPPSGLDIGPEQRALVRAILHAQVPEYGVWAFGSRTQGRARPYSDLDLVIETDRPLGLARLAALGEAFSESDLPWRVDIVDWCSAGEPFRRIIARDRVLVQEAPGSDPSGPSCGALIPP